MIAAGLALIALGAVVHGYVFVLESVLWTGPRARRVFGLTADEARVTAPLALNQGFYNLFLAIDVVVGLVLILCGARTAGFTATVVGGSSMAAAALVLIVSDRTKLRPALVQGAAPLIGVLLLAVCALLRT